jgi:hypothetical protein
MTETEPVSEALLSAERRMIGYLMNNELKNWTEAAVCLSMYYIGIFL